MSKTHEETGRVVLIGDEQTVTTKAGTPYHKRLLVIETQNDAYTDRLPFEFGGDRCAMLKNLQPGETVTVRFYLSGWQDRAVFVRPITVAVVVPQQQAQPQPQQPAQPQRQAQAIDQLTALYGGAQQPQQQQQSSIFEGDNDPLPF